MLEFTLQRGVLGWLIAARSERGHFADYHERFRPDEPNLLCQCGKKRAQLYPFSCLVAKPYRGKLFCNKLERQPLPKEVLERLEELKSSRYEALQRSCLE